MRSVALLTLFGLLVPAGGRAAVLTADQAVKISLQKNTSVIGAEASVLSARSGLWSAYAEMVPNVSGTYDVRNTKLNPKGDRSEEHTSELQSHSFISYAVFCLKKNK